MHPGNDGLHDWSEIWRKNMDGHEFEGTMIRVIRVIRGHSLSGPFNEQGTIGRVKLGQSPLCTR